MSGVVSQSKEYRIFAAYLGEKGFKMTGARSAVLEAFLSLERHVSVEELLAAARRVDPTIGQATVFRTIKLLESSGLAREARRGEGSRLYEHAFNHVHHDHLVCVLCGRTIEFMDEGIEEAQRRVYEASGFEIVSHQLELRGICPACGKKGQQSRRAADNAQ